jgi:CubicO group peptidase (beta-lactamase class C family)
MEKNAKFDFIAKKIKTEMRKLQIPGVAIGIYHHGEIHTAGFGVTNVDNPLPITPQTLFPIGSISKTFTALLAMRLVEKGLLDLDTPIKKYLPNFKMKDANTKNKVTMRHLLTHVGGWSGDYFQEQGDGEDALAKIAAEVAHLPQQFPLGEMFSYNNSGFYLAGHVIQQICQKPFETLMQELVFAPMELKQAYYFIRDYCGKRFTVGHHNAPDVPPIVLSQYGCGRMANPAGGIVTNIEELLRYARIYLHKGKNEHGNRVLSSDTIHQLLVPQVSVYNQEQDKQSIALSWFYNELGDIKVYSHGGGVTAQCALLAFAPEHDFAFALLTNSSAGIKLLHLLTPQIYLQYLGINQSMPKPKRWPASFLKQYLGTYAGSTGEKIIIDKNEKNLIFQFIPSPEIMDQLKIPAEHRLNPPTIEIGLVSEDMWVIVGNEFPGMRGEFIRDANGNIAWLRAGRVAKKIN